MRDHNMKKMVTAALLAAMTCIATMIIKIPTPTFGYIHPGDCFVLLCGILLGPWQGALAAGIGSMFSDIFSGYASWAPATLIIKAATATIAGIFFHRFYRSGQTKKQMYVSVIISGLLGEAVMVLGYFLYEAFLAAFGSGAFSTAALAAGFASSALGIPFNLVQGAVGILLCVILLPLLLKIEDVREWIGEHSM